MAIITSSQKKINSEIEAIRLEKERKKALLSQKRLERQEIESDREKQQLLLNEIQKKEAELRAEIQNNERKNSSLRIK